MAKRAWPKIRYKARRGVTAEEHEKIVAAEHMDDYRLFFKLVWETGGSQTDVAHLDAEDINWTTHRLHYSRKKMINRSGGKASLVVGPRLEEILRQLPTSGPLFPRLKLLSEDERASHFRKVCLRAGVTGVTLHSYRYGWAERAYAAGMPEREAQAHLGHNRRLIARGDLPPTVKVLSAPRLYYTDVVGYLDGLKQKRDAGSQKPFRQR